MPILTKPADPYAQHFSTINASDLVLVDEEGRPAEPTSSKVNAAGFIIHSSIHKARPDINAACHLHSPHGRAWSTFGKPIEMLNQGKLPWRLRILSVRPGPSFFPFPPLFVG